MQKISTALLAAIGVHQTLSAEQKHDLVVAAVQSTPSAVFAGGAQVVAPPAALHVVGISMNDLLLFSSFAFILLQCGYLVWKWRRDARRDRERQEDRRNLVRRATPDTDFGELGAED